MAKQVRVRWADLKQHMGTREAAPAASVPMALGFVEVPSAPAGPQPPPTIQVEFHRTDGARLCLHAPESTLPLAALVRAFLEVG